MNGSTPQTWYLAPSTCFNTLVSPSYTGRLHLGHATTFWTAFTRARDAHGTLLLRNEDLDPQRSRPEFTDAMLEDLSWLGIAWQPPMISQSERLPLYRAAFERLLHFGHIYPCTCSRRDLSRICRRPTTRTTSRSTTAIAAPRHSQPHPSPPTTAAASPTAKPSASSTATSAPHAFSAGSASANPQTTFGDFLVWRKPVPGDPHEYGLPSYQLACVADDAAMRITEVVRGADLLKSTARQILLQRALSLPPVDYFHTALLRDEHGVRLAKRHDALALRTLREQGLTPAEVRAHSS
jgi:glutamyl/glutaminyl-tRNA synthetase